MAHKPKQPKPPKHAVIDTAGPSLVAFYDSIRDAKAAADASATYIAVSLAPHPKKQPKPAKW